MQPRVIFPRSLKYLMAVAEHRSFTRAAEALHVSQPSLSQQIKQLEESLGTQLVDRSGRTVRLTDAGEIYMRHALRAWNELCAATRAIHEVEDLSRGTLRVGWNPITDYLACSLVTRFNSLYPGITVTTLEMPQHQIESALLEDRIDVGIAFSRQPAATAATTTAASAEIETRVLFEEALCLAVGSRHPRAGQQTPLDTEALGRESLAMLNEEFALRRHIDEYCSTQGIAPRIAIETDSLSVLIELVRTGGTLATVLPVTIVHDQCGMHAVPLAPEIPRKTISVICRRGGYTSPACRAFKALALEWTMRRLQEIPPRTKGFCPLLRENFRQEPPQEEMSVS